MTKAAPPAGRKKGPRPKHVPQRMCIICRDHDAKRGLHRIVRSPEGVVSHDPTGRRNGRGAYLCHKTACWEKALSSGALARALNIEIDTETLDALRQHAATLPLEPSALASASSSGTATSGGAH
ncbi:MAG: YlxR family protein [Thermomicrobiales bacterium]